MKPEIIRFRIRRIYAKDEEISGRRDNVCLVICSGRMKIEILINSLSGKVYADPVCFTETDQGVGIYQMEDDKDQKYLVLHYLEPSENQICMVVNEEAFYANLISSIKVGTNGYVMIKNSEGKIIMHPKGEQWGIDVIEGRKEMYPHLDLSSLEHMIEKQKEGGEGILEYDSYWWTMPNLPKVHKVSAYSSADLGGDFWVVSAVIDYDDMYLPIRQGFTRILFVMLGILLLIIILLIFVGRLVFDRQKSAAEIIYLRELNSLLEEVHQSEENIAHQERLQIMGTMTGGIAHEFNNFLTPIMGYAELLMMELPEDSEEYDSAHEIYEASEKAKDVVRQISTLSRKNVETVYKSIPAAEVDAKSSENDFVRMSSASDSGRTDESGSYMDPGKYNTDQPGALKYQCECNPCNRKTERDNSYSCT